MSLSLSLTPILAMIGHDLIFACVSQNVHLEGFSFPLIAISHDDMNLFQGMLFLGQVFFGEIIVDCSDKRS